MWSFITDPAFQTELDWIDEFVRQEVEPLDFVLPEGDGWRITVDTDDDERGKAAEVVSGSVSVADRSLILVERRHA